MTATGAPSPRRRTCRSSASVGPSAQCRSSMTNTRGADRATRSIRSLTASNSFHRPPSATSGDRSSPRVALRRSWTSEFRDPRVDAPSAVTISVNGWYGAMGSSSHRPWTTIAPVSYRRRAASAATRDLPMPGSPASRTRRRAGAAGACSLPCSRRSSSVTRPTSWLPSCAAITAGSGGRGMVATVVAVADRTGSVKPGARSP